MSDQRTTLQLCDDVTRTRIHAREWTARPTASAHWSKRKRTDTGRSADTCNTTHAHTAATLRCAHRANARVQLQSNAGALVKPGREEAIVPVNQRQIAQHRPHDEHAQRLRRRLLGRPGVVAAAVGAGR